MSLLPKWEKRIDCIGEHLALRCGQVTLAVVRNIDNKPSWQASYTNYEGETWWTEEKTSRSVAAAKKAAEKYLEENDA